MKYKLVVLLAALLCAGGIVAPKTAKALSFNIEVGDRPYYTHGPWYWNHGARWYWIPGHWGWRYHHRVWIRGHYAPR